MSKPKMVTRSIRLPEEFTPLLEKTQAETGLSLNSIMRVALLSFWGLQPGEKKS